MSDSTDQSVRMGGFSNLDTQQLQALCFTSARSVRRWKKTNTMPRLAHFVLELLFYGHLGTLSPAFNGWKLRDGKIHTPQGVQFGPAELLAVPLKYQLVSELEKTNRERQRNIDALTKASATGARVPCGNLGRRTQRRRTPPQDRSGERVTEAS